MRPAAVGFAPGSDVQAIGDGDFIFSEGVETPTLFVNAAVGDTISVIIVPIMGVKYASVFNCEVSDGGNLVVTSAVGQDAFSDITFVNEGDGKISIKLLEFVSDFIVNTTAAAVCVTVNNNFCGRILAADNESHLADASEIIIPVLLNGSVTVQDGSVTAYSSYVHCEESTVQNPLAWFDFPSDAATNKKLIHLEIFMFNALASMFTCTTNGGPEVETIKRRYGLVIDVVPDGDVPFAMYSAKLFGADPSWWCPLTEV